MGPLDRASVVHAVDRRVPERARPLWDIGRRTVAQVREDRLILVSAGVAFFALLSIPPMLFATLAVYGLFTTPEEVERQLAELSDLLPEDVQGLLREQLSSLTQTSPDRLSTGAIFAVLAALWAASTGMKFLLVAVGVAFDIEERRSGLRVRGLSLLFALVTVLLVGLAIAAGAVLPALLPDDAGARLLVRGGAWLAVALVGAVAVSLIYRFGPSRPVVRWRANTWGAAVAMLTWLLGSALYFFYVGSFGSYGETYGALANIAITMLWALLTAFAILLGAEVDAVLGRYRRDRPAGHDPARAPKPPATTERPARR